MCSSKKRSAAWPLADIADRLQYLADRGTVRLEAWATGHGGGDPELDRYLPPPAPSTAEQISEFIAGKLVPRLSVLNGSVDIVEEQEATHPKAKVGERFVDELRSDFALVGDTMYRLAPFSGTFLWNTGQPGTVSGDSPGSVYWYAGRTSESGLGSLPKATGRGPPKHIQHQLSH